MGLTGKEKETNERVLDYVRDRLESGEQFTGQIILHCNRNGIRRVQVSDFFDAEDLTPGECPP